MMSAWIVTPRWLAWPVRSAESDDDQTTRCMASAAGAGEAINSDHKVYVVPVCLQPPHPCADSCGRANASRPIFVDAT
jgi:hypothetical protein